MKHWYNTMEDHNKMLEDDFNANEGMSGNKYEADPFDFTGKEERDYDDDMTSNVAYKLTKRYPR